MNVHEVRKQFPFFENTSCIYLDNAATTQKPKIVIDRLTQYYSCENANLNRGDYLLSNELSNKIKKARETIADFIHARSDEIIFTKNATEALNLVASSLCSQFNEHDCVLLSYYEHHANYLPWIEHGNKKRLEIRQDSFERKIDWNHVKVMSISALSNVDGRTLDCKKWIQEAHKHDCLTVIDATAYIAHERVNVKELDVDFLCFSGHKLYGPQGIGVLYVKKDKQSYLKPLLYGGGIVEDITSKPIYKNNYELFEAGTVDCGAILGLETAIKFLQENFDEWIEYEKNLSDYCWHEIKTKTHFRVLYHNEPILSLVHDKISAYDISKFLSLNNIAVRCGHLCAKPYLNVMNLKSVCRISFSFYNTKQEVDNLIKCLCKLEDKIGSLYEIRK